MQFAKKLLLVASVSTVFPFSASAELNWDKWSTIRGDDDGKALLSGINENFGKVKDNLTSVDKDLQNSKDEQEKWNQTQGELNARQKEKNEQQDKINENQGNWNQGQENWNKGQESLNEKQKEINHRQSLQNDKFRKDIGRLNARVSDVENKMKKGFASQAALSGLFQPYGVGKANLSMAFGGYESHSAIAVGSGYRFNENVAIKTGIATNTEDFSGLTYSTGINFEW
ncbi:YadA-like family protein [Enterobacter cloacae]|uniref:YadA C-terminal domain-containing protein n=1 Tax=Enterobacter cloacae TaxID=550 RepID=UPI00345DAF26